MNQDPEATRQWAFNRPLLRAYVVTLVTLGACTVVLGVLAYVTRHA